MTLPVQILESVESDRCILISGRRASIEATAMAGEKRPAESKMARLMTGKKTPFGDAINAYEAEKGINALRMFMLGQLNVSGLAPTSYHIDAVKRFPLIISTSQDDLFERAAKSEGIDLIVLERGAPLPTPDPETRVLYKMWGSLEKPDTLGWTPEQRAVLPAVPEFRKRLRKLLVKHTLFFVGYRADDAEFTWAFEEFSDGFGGKLPRCHLAVTQGRISDFYWQKWVWRGLLLFTADPTEVSIGLVEAVGAP